MLAPACPGGIAVLPSYRLYCLDGTGRITTAEWLEANDDAEATKQAHERKLRVASEVWDRSRLVARIEAKKPD